jgi:hypothetical protein
MTKLFLFRFEISGFFLVDAQPQSEIVHHVPAECLNGTGIASRSLHGGCFVR